MELFAVGLNHNSAPLALRERLAFPPETLNQALAHLRLQLTPRSAPAEPEVAILSTCNRTEVYCAAPNAESAKTQLFGWLAHYQGLEPQSLHTHLYTLPQHEVIRHAFRVASGLDSMVLGEAQILGQIKQAARFAKEANTLGPLLHQLFQRTFSVAKAVRSQTNISSYSVSMASIGVRLAQRIFGDLSTRHVLCVGAGEMIQLCATHLAAQDPRSMTIANRSAPRAIELSSRLSANAKVISLAQLAQEIPKADIVISCTGSTLPVIGLGAVQAALKARKNTPLFMLDLAVPRDIEAQVGELDDVFLYTVDDLSQLAQQGREHREAAVDEAESIIDEQVKAFIRWTDERLLVPTIRDLHQKGEEIAQFELEYARKSLAKGEPTEEVLQLMAHRLSAKFLHGPMHALHKAPDHDREVLLKWLPQLLNVKTRASDK